MSTMDYSHREDLPCGHARRKVRAVSNVENTTINSFNLEVMTVSKYIHLVQCIYNVYSFSLINHCHQSLNQWFSSDFAMGTTFFFGH